MGCAATKADDGDGGGYYNCFHPNRPVLKTEEELERHKEEFKEQYHGLLARISDYQKESCEYLNHLYLEPRTLLPESLNFGYVSPEAFFNLFHAGFCGPYIANPNYLLLVDFRSREEYQSSHLLTASHFESLSWDMVDSLHPRSAPSRYSAVVFYDQDGTAAANVLSVLHRAFAALKRKQVEDVFIVLGGFAAVGRRFPHLVAANSNPGSSLRNGDAGGHAGAPRQVKFSSHSSPPPRKVIPWMPTLVRTAQLYLGRHEQAESGSVICGLGLTHLLSIGRSPENRFDCVTYLGLDGERDLLSTLETSGNIIQTVIDKGGRILVHGVEGLNRSAAVVIAHLMKSVPCTLEDAYFYVQVLRPFIRLDDECLDCLLRYEKLLFGSGVTDLEELWV